MLVAILADLHANLLALERVWNDFPQEVAEVWLLGDVFGRGPHPVEVWEFLAARRRRIRHWLAGNWDWGLLGRLLPRHFQPRWRENLRFQRQHLQFLNSWPQIESGLAHLPFLELVAERQLLLAHGSFGLPASPPPSEASLAERVLGDYLWSSKEVSIAWQRWQTFVRRPWSHPRLHLEEPLQVSWIVVAHTHQPMWWVYQEGRFVPCSWQVGEWIPGCETFPWVLNPGSVGAARNHAGDRLETFADYLLVELSSDKPWPTRIQFRRVAFSPRRLRESMVNFYGERLAREYLPLWGIKVEGA